MPEEPRFVVCVNNADYPASLETRKIYEVVGDETGGFLRIVDESGEDYLYPEEFFVPIDLPQNVRAALRKAS